ncbi:GNAT family N-acetyltransferase [Actinoallomurus purpureus]|uniref:GNAT family N-acetyltransferase n=1 Tax=Actinoallomurus purpureus TaxID=478114 RepID=UPI002091FE73|nr:GNAT family N-acetyltransferase [Actinoallomurus purpureus]MCO6011371.1 GNAT family N-acetyltransferase [Actinoallomurus purpureus]
MMNDVVTERLVLHPLNSEDAERIAARTPGDTDRWAPGYPTDGDVKAANDHLAHCTFTGDPRPFGAYEIRRREDGYAIGGVGFHRPPDENGVVTIGYGLVSSVRGQGYATEALRGLLAFAEANGVTLVKGDADHDNVASQRVMTAAGMRQVGEDDRVKYYEIAWTR